jgi:biopolymer transport protein ExbB
MQFDLAHMWASMGLASRLVAFSLVLMAVIVIGVVVERLILLSRSTTATSDFVKAIHDRLAVWDLRGVREAAAAHERSMLARVVLPVVKRYERAQEEPEGNVLPVELARREAARRREAVSADLRRGLSVLASVGSVAPFIGLLGTVVGIISAFQGIAATGSGGLGSVSAGISEALIETALGLLVAIPTVLLFNFLNTRVSRVELAIERSVGELLDEMENAHGRRSGEHTARVDHAA